MSGEILFDVMNCDGFGKPAFKLLLIALADRADETGVCWPSREDLVLRTGMSLSALTRSARALENAGWIQRKQRRDTSTKYRLNVVKIARCAAQCKANRELRKAGGEWAPFPEEVAQATENNGEGQIDPSTVQPDPSTGHTDHLTSQEPLKNPRARARAIPAKKKPDRPPAQGTPAGRESNLWSEYRSAAAQGRPVRIFETGERLTAQEFLRKYGASVDPSHVEPKAQLMQQRK